MSGDCIGKHLVIVCKCGFETGSAKEMLKHYEEKHGLEKDGIKIEVPLKELAEDEDKK
jgi:hypothetical protein